MKASDNNSRTPPRLRFPRLSSTGVAKPWQPELVGDGEFPKEQASDPIRIAQEALHRLEAGMLKLHKAVQDDDTTNDRPKAA